LKLLSNELAILSKAIEQSETSLIITDADFKIEHVNSVYTKITGYSLDETIGQRPQILQNNQHERLCEEIIYTLSKTECWKGVLSSIKKSGEPLFEKVTITQNTDDDNLTNYIILKEDITEERDSQEGLVALFANLTSGFAEHEMIYDDDSNPIDYRFLWINNIFTVHTTLTKDIIGKTVLEVAPDTERYWIEKYAEVVKTGTSIKYENYSVHFNKYYSVTAFRTRAGCFATLFDDITEKKLHNESLKRLADIQSVILNLSSKYINMDLDEMNDGINNSLKEIGDFAQADRAYIFEYDFDNGVSNNLYEWCNKGITPQIDNLQNYPLSEVAPEWIANHKKNEPVEYSDISEISSKELRESLLNQGIKSLLAIPIFNEHELFGFLGFDSVKVKHSYSNEEKTMLKLFAQIFINIQNRQTSEDELRSSEISYQSLFEQSADSIIIIDPKTDTITDCNQNTVKILCANSKEEIINSSVANFCPKHQPDGRLSSEVAKTNFDKTLEDGYSSFEFIYKTSTGKEFYSTVNLGLLSYNNNILLQASIHDITKQKQQQQQIEHSEQMLKISTENSGIAAWEYNFNISTYIGTEIYTNIYGFDPNDGNVPDKIISGAHPNDKDYIISEFRNLIENKTEYYNVEFRYKKPNTDSYIWIGENARIINRNPDGTPINMIGATKDITERKSAVEKIKQSEERFRLSTESANIATWEWHINKNSAETSKMYLDILGFDGQGSVSDYWKAHIHPDDYDAVIKASDKHLEGKSPTYSATFRFFNEQKEEYIWLSETGKIFEWDNDGNPTLMVGITQDVTTDKKQQESIAKSEKELKLLNQILSGTMNATDVGIWWTDFSKEDTFSTLDSTAQLLNIKHLQRQDGTYAISDFFTLIENAEKKDPKYLGFTDQAKELFAKKVDGTADLDRLQIPILSANDSIKWIDSRISVPERNEDGRAKTITGMIVDVTKIMNANEEITRREKDFKIIFESSTAGLVIIDSETHQVVNANSSMLKMLKSPNKDSLLEMQAGLPCPEYQPNGQKSINFIDEKLKEIMESDTITAPAFDYSHNTFDGNTIICEVKLQSGTYENKPIIIASLWDVTARKRAEEKQRVYTQRLLSLAKVSEYEIDTIHNYLDYVLEVIISLTLSKFGYINIYDEDKQELTPYSFSKNILSDYTEKAKNTKYKLEDVTFWGEVIRERKAIIANKKNDVQEYLKKIPEDVNIEKFLSMPILYENKIVATLNIANKPTDYTQADLKQITLMMDSAWKKLTLFRNEQAILESKNTAEMVIKLSPVPLTILNLKTLKVLDCNEAMLDFMRIDSIDYYDPNKLYPDLNDRKKVLDIYSTKGKVDKLEVKLKRLGTGEHVWAYMNMHPVHFMGENCAIVSLTDLTAIKESEEKFRLSETRLSQASKGANVGLFNFYPISGVMQINSTWVTQLGYEPWELRDSNDEWSTLTGGHDGWVKLLHPDDKKNTQKNLKEYIDNNIDEYKTQYRLRCRDGSYKWILSSGEKLLSNETGQVVQVTGVHILIDEIKETQDQLLEAKLDAEKASKVKSEFLANMSHEIRTPMNAVIGLNNLLQNTKLTSKQSDYVHKIENSANSLLGIINDILDFSKLESGNMHIENIAFSLDEVLSDLSTMTSFKAYEKGLEFLINRDPRIPNNLIGDPLRIGQVLLNLTSNAIKFTEKGEVLVELSYVDSPSKDHTTIKFSISDTGIGMNETQQEKLFNAFQQADTSTTRKYGGTGLGLIITKNIINLMGADVSVKSEYGKGSEFSFTICLKKSQNKLMSPPTIHKNISDMKILAVDDSFSARIILESYLGQLQTSPVIVSSGVEALEAIKKESFDLILLDWKMPEMSGLDTLTMMKKSGDLDDNTKAILITSYSYDEMADKAKDIGFSLVIPKPFTQSSLFDAIIGVYSSKGIPNTNLSQDTDHPFGFDKIRGAKILLAEDNEINQQVARELLEYEGFFVDVAANGKICLEMADKNQYDLILMDLQMPIMDGFEATKLLLLKHADKTPPIIALSADAMIGVKNRVVSVGMSDYISKPINKHDLFHTLAKWIKPAKRTLKKLEERKIPIFDTDYYINTLTCLDVNSALYRTSNNIKLYTILLEKFATNNEHFFTNLTRTIMKGNINDAKKDIHSIKGVAGNIGAKHLYEYITQIENKLIYNDIDNIYMVIADANTQLSKIITQVRKLLNELKESSSYNKNNKSKSISKKNLITKLENLFDELENSSIKSQDQCEELLKYYYNDKAVQDLQNIERAISDFDSEKASSICKNLIAELRNNEK